MKNILEKINAVYVDIVDKQKEMDRNLVDVVSRECCVAEGEKALKAKAEDISSREKNLVSPEELIALSATTKAALQELKRESVELNTSRNAFSSYRETEKDGIISKKERLDKLLTENLKREILTKEKLAETIELKENYKQIALNELQKLQSGFFNKKG